MPFKSKAQMRKFGELMKQGKITKNTFDEFAHATPSLKNLPDRVGPMKPNKPLAPAKPMPTGLDRIKKIKIK